MKLVVTLVTALVLSWNASGASFTITDPYHGQIPNPADIRGSEIGDDDVKGFIKSFDIEKVTIGNTGNTVTIGIYMNYGTDGGDTGLNPVVTSGFPNVFPGDVLLFTPNGNFAVPLITHNSTAPGAGVTAFSLYQANSWITAGTLYPAEAISMPNAFRPGEIVWVDPLTAALLAAGAGNVSSTGGAGSKEILVQITITNAALAAEINNGTFFLSFASATCGNDMITGGGLSDVPTPEPISLTLIGGGLLGLAWLRRRS